MNIVFSGTLADLHQLPGKCTHRVGRKWLSLSAGLEQGDLLTVISDDVELGKIAFDRAERDDNLELADQNFDPEGLRDVLVSIYGEDAVASGPIVAVFFGQVEA